MSYQLNDMSGSIFNNDKKQTDKQPDMTGSAIVNGVEVWVSAWNKKSKNGKEFISLAFKRKDEVQRAGVQKAKEAVKEGDFTDDTIPF